MRISETLPWDRRSFLPPLPARGGGGGGWVLYYIHTYVGSGYFFLFFFWGGGGGVQNSEYQYSLGFQKNEFFGGYEDFADIFWGHRKIGLI